MKTPLPKSIFDLIDSDHFREKASLYLGEKSITKLRIFMTGYELCEIAHEIRRSNTKPPFWLFFHWICKYYHHSGSYYSWDGIILQNCNQDEEKALETFFLRFDEFRKFTPQRIMTARIQKQEIDFFYTQAGIRRLWNGKENLRIGPADQVYIIEYDEELGCSSHHEKEGKWLHYAYFESTHEAKAEAAREYGKSLSWTEVSQDEIEAVYDKII